MGHPRRTLLVQLRVVLQSTNLLRTLSRQTYWHFQPAPLPTPYLLSQVPLPILTQSELVGLSPPGREIFSTPCTRCSWNAQTELTPEPFKKSRLNPPHWVLMVRLYRDRKPRRGAKITTIARKRENAARQSSAGGRERADLLLLFPHFRLALSIRSYRPPGLPLRRETTRSRRENDHYPLLLSFPHHNPKPSHTRAHHS